jgi:hypothetical protein
MQQTAAKDPQGFKEFRSLAMNLMVGNQWLHEFSFKQFRDAENPDDACYQSVVASRAKIRVREMRELGHRTSIRIQRFPTHPIVETLGLRHKGPDPDAKAPYFLLQACRPFFIRADVTTALGENIVARAGHPDWPPQMRNLSPAMRAPGAALVDEVDREPRDLAQKVEVWLDGADNPVIGGARADELMDSAFQPHMAIHAMLSREWEHHGNSRWSRARTDPSVRQLPLFVVPTDSVGTEEGTVFPERERVRNECEPCYWTPPDDAHGET